MEEKLIVILTIFFSDVTLDKELVSVKFWKPSKTGHGGHRVMMISVYPVT